MSQPILEGSEGVGSLLFEEHPTWNQLIHNHIPITLFSAYTVLLFFLIKHHLSKSGVRDLLTLIQLFLPRGNHLASTQEMFIKGLKFNSEMTKCVSPVQTNHRAIQMPCLQ